MNAPVKRCYMCKQTLPIDQFPKNRSKKDGLSTECFVCARERANRYRLAHPDRKSEQDRNYRLKNQEKIALQKREEYLAHPERQNARNSRWKKRNHERVNTMTRRRRARKRNLPDALTFQEWQTCLNYWHHCCAVCGRPPGLWHTLSADHWIPLSAPDCPGTVATNMIPLCNGIDGCNNSKNDRDAQEWLISKLGKRKARAKLAEIAAYFDWIREQDKP